MSKHRVDAVLAVAARKAPRTDPRPSTVEGPLLLVTAYRRESWGRRWTASWPR